MKKDSRSASKLEGHGSSSGTGFYASEFNGAHPFRYVSDLDKSVWNLSGNQKKGGGHCRGERIY